MLCCTCVVYQYCAAEFFVNRKALEHTSIYIYIYVYIYLDIDIDIDKDIDIYIYKYIYIYIKVCIDILLINRIYYYIPYIL